MTFDLDKFDDVVKREDFISLALDLLAKIGVLVAGAKPDTAASVMTLLKVLFHHLNEAYSGVVDPKAVKAELQKLLDTVKTHDIAADEALKAKFHRGDE